MRIPHPLHPLFKIRSLMVPKESRNQRMKSQVICSLRRFVPESVNHNILLKVSKMILCNWWWLKVITKKWLSNGSIIIICLSYIIFTHQVQSWHSINEFIWKLLLTQHLLSFLAIIVLICLECFCWSLKYFYNIKHHVLMLKYHHAVISNITDWFCNEVSSC